MRTRFWILLLLLVLVPSWGRADITEITGQRLAAGSPTGVDSKTFAYPGNTVSGHLLVLCYAGWQAAVMPASTTITDTQGNTWTKVETHDGSRTRYGIAYTVTTSNAANTVTINPEGALAYISAAITEFAGQNSPVQDVIGTPAIGTSTSPSMTLTTGTTSALMVGVMTDNGTVNTNIVSGSGWTTIGEIEDGATVERLSCQTKTATTASSYTVNWTITSALWGVHAVSFIPATTSPPTAIPRRRPIYQ